MPEQIRLLRYHMTSGHVLQEIVDPEIPDSVDDATLLEYVTETLQGKRNGYIKINEATSESAVLVSVERIEFVQVASATLQVSAEAVANATASEDSAIERAMKKWRKDVG